MTGAESSSAELADALLAAADAAGLDAREVSCLQRLSGGASKEMWGFTLALADGAQRQLVLRRQAPDRRFSMQGLSSVAAEARIVRRAQDAGVPVAGIAFELPRGSPAGDGYAMECVDGETVGGRVLKLPELAEARKGMARRCGEILARLHSIENYNDLGLRTHNAREALDALADRYYETGRARPVFAYALHWLRDNLPYTQARALLHGDFRNGNLVVGPDGIRAVLDWELAHIGPPVSDLAWLCVPSWRFQNPGLPVGGFGSRVDLIDGYRSAGGREIDREEMRAWEVFHTMNWGVMCAGGAAAFMDGQRSVEGAVIARRASETEFDLMRMLAPDHPAWAEARRAG